MNKQTARRGYWMASLIVPGWSQLMANRILEAIAWLTIAALAWGNAVVAGSREVSTLLICIPAAGLWHVVSAWSAYHEGLK